MGLGWGGGAAALAAAFAEAEEALRFMKRWSVEEAAVVDQTPMDAQTRAG
jgi:hypothetical protein